MNEVVSSYQQEIKFIIGFAGSGKSTLLAERTHEDSLVMTPTHKAAAVLMGKGIKNVYTLHSVLKLVPTINMEFRKGQRLERLKRIGDTDLSKIKEVFIDEYSMVSTKIADILLNALPEHCVVTFIGDAYQLPPVDGESMDPLDYTSTDNIEELTTQHRSDAPEVVETFMRYVGFLNGTGEMNLKLNPSIKTGNLLNFNPETDRALAYTNKTVIAMNDTIAKVLGLSEILEDDDDVVINGIQGVYSSDTLSTPIFPTCMSKGRLMEHDALLIASQKTQSDIDKYNTDIKYSECSITIDGETYSLHYDLHHYHTSKVLKKKVESAQHLMLAYHKLDKDTNITQWCKENRGAKYIKERGKAWAEYLSHKNLVFDLRRPYATTVHKAQGSEFDTVYIDQNDIKKSIRNNYYEQYARLMYVALSRAKHKVVIV